MMLTSLRDSVRRSLRAFGFSCLGLKAAYRQEWAFRQELRLLPVFAVLGLLLGRGAAEQALLVGSWVVVIIVELLNSAVEAVVDRVGTERHELSGRAKDLGSAAVLISLVLVALVWALVAWHRLAG